MDDIPQFVQQASAHAEGNDRTCAIMHAADLENCIDKALLRHFEPNRSNGLFKANGPLGSFANKIEVLYALQKINDETYRNLQIIRLVRNVFAHTIVPVTFDTAEIAQLCSHFATPKSVNEEFDKLSQLMPDDRHKFSSTKWTYSTVCRQLAANFVYLHNWPDRSLP